MTEQHILKIAAQKKRIKKLKKELAEKNLHINSMSGEIRALEQLNEEIRYSRNPRTISASDARRWAVIGIAILSISSMACAVKYLFF